MTGVLAQVWFERAALAGQYVGLLAFAHVLAVAYAIVAIVRDWLGVDDDAPWVLRADMAVLVAAVVAYLGLHGALARSEFAAPTPLFALLGLDVALVLLVASAAAGRRWCRWRRSPPCSSPDRGTRSTSRSRPARSRSSPRSRSTCCSWRCRSS